jgi:hypothetical protein
LAEPERAPDQAERPAGGFAPRPRHLVVKFGVLEVRKLEGERLFEHHLVHALTEQRAQQLIADGEPARDRGEERYQTELDRHVGDRGVAITRRPRGRGVHHRVHDQLADVGDCGRQRTGKHAEPREDQRKPLTRGPDQRQRAPRIGVQSAEVAEAAFRGTSGAGQGCGGHLCSFSDWSRQK